MGKGGEIFSSQGNFSLGEKIEFLSKKMFSHFFAIFSLKGCTWCLLYMSIINREILAALKFGGLRNEKIGG